MLPPCEICGLAAHGNHFGVLSCRACAAFFRRSASIPKKLKNINCPHDRVDIQENGSFSCKKCRLKRCLERGMDASKFQHDRDAISSSSYSSPSSTSSPTTIMVPQSLATFLGRPSFLMFCDPETSEMKRSFKTIVDCNYLIDKAYEILKFGSSKPYQPGLPSLEKLSISFENMRLDNSSELQYLSYVEKDHTLLFWEQEFLNTAEWLANFSEFTALPITIQMEILKTIWSTWGRLERLARTASFRRRKMFTSRNIVIAGDEACIDVENTDMDVSWFTDYTREDVSYFMDYHRNPLNIQAMDELEALNPSTTELNFMLLQLCLHQAGKILQGDVLNFTDHIQDVVANQLHNYYVNVRNTPNYSGRLAKMMKINNLLRQEQFESCKKMELAFVFDVFRLAFSHPEMMCRSGK